MSSRKKPTYVTATSHSRADTSRKLRLSRETLKELAPGPRTVGGVKDAAFTAKCVTFSGATIR